MQQNDYSQDQPIWTAAGHDITIRWREKYGWKPASELPDIRAKHDFFRLRQYENKGVSQ